jgi:hypothetical protein
MAIKISSLMNSGLLNSNNSITSLFDAMSRNKSNGTSGPDLTQYNVVNTSAYRKALTAYYKKESGDAGANVKDNSSEMSTLKNVATNLKDSANAISNASLYKQDKDGEYDLDGIKKAAEDFVDKYNKMVDEAAKSNSNETLRNGVWMVNNTQKNESLLSKAGITIGKDNKLSFDSSRVTKGNVSHLKSVFSGRSSFGGRVASKASNFESIAKRGLSNHTYNRTGNYQIAKDVATRLNRKA